MHISLSDEVGLSGGSDGKESACNAGDLGSVPGLERSPGEGNGYSLQYSYQDKSVDRGALWAAHGVSEIWTQTYPGKSTGEFHGLYSPWDRKNIGDFLYSGY